MADVKAEAKPVSNEAQSVNPGSPVERPQRVPMSVPQQQLATPQIPGWHLHWMKGSVRVQQALRAGYEFVDIGEIPTNSTLLGSPLTVGASTDLGTRVSVLAGKSGSERDVDGQPMRLYLMKLREEWRKEDQEKLAQQSERIADALRSQAIGKDKEEPGDRGMCYGDAQAEFPSGLTPRGPMRRAKIPDLFTRKP